MSSAPSKRKRSYREKVICSTCKKELDSDYRKEHGTKQHPGMSPEFSRVLLKGQETLKFIPKVKQSTEKAPEHSNTSTPEAQIIDSLIETSESESHHLTPPVPSTSKTPLPSVIDTNITRDVIDNNISPTMPLSSNADVLLPC